MLYLLAPASSHIYLFSTHITRTKLLVAGAVVLVAVIAVVAWLVRRRRTRSGSGG